VLITIHWIRRGRFQSDCASRPVAEILTMTKTEPRNKVRTWAKPELVRLGKLTDVAGAPAGAVQNATKS
jgi:hypothetical protein